MAFVSTAAGVGAPAARALGGRHAATTTTARPAAAAAAAAVSIPRMAYGGRGYPSVEAQREAWRRFAAARAAGGGGQQQQQGRRGRECGPGQMPSQEELMAAMSGMAADFMRTYGAVGGVAMGGRCGPPRRQQQQGQRQGQQQQQGRQWQQPQAQRVDWVPRAERAETPTTYVWRLELPGVRKGQVKTELKGADRVIVISGEKTRPSSASGGSGAASTDGGAAEEVRTVRGELTYGSFARTLRMPTDADLDATDRIRATVTEGVLTVTVPKVKAEPAPEAEPPVQIPIA